MENRLKLLYQLQRIDDELDLLEELRGDLPLYVESLEEKINQLKESIKFKEKQKEESFEKIKGNEVEIERLKDAEKKYKAQLYSVRNNKEYDALTKEIDNTSTTIKKIETENNSLENLNQKLVVEIDELKPKYEDLQNELKIKQNELKQIIKSNEKEEERLRSERAKIEEQMKKGDYAAYLRIRKAKRGKAVATIKRSACSGCNNIVPAQRQLEIRRNNKIFFCEFCGRILVSAEISEGVEGKNS
ncbi:MAG: C4-type zinc ribbon domain-containing protein [Ignavibacterium sp.]